VEYDAEWAPADLAAFEGDWSWFDTVVGPALASGPGGHVDDDIAYVTPWGCDPSNVVAPVLLLHGGRDRIVPASHGRWLARRCPSAHLRLSPEDGHISVLDSAADALEWLHSVTR
jgi:pimeloyl-ACP methyl ester carboxylesterase